MGKHLRRALRDTLQQAGHWSGVLFLAGVPLLALGAHLFLFGKRAMLNQVSPAISFFAALSAAALLLFVFNLIASPYRFQKERADASQIQMNELSNEVGQIRSTLQALQTEKPDLRLTVSQIWWSSDSNDMPGKALVCALMAVANVGRMPSIADNWALELMDISGGRHRGQLFHTQTLTVGIGNPITFENSDFIATKTARPLAQGDKVSGLFFALFPISLFKEERPNHLVGISTHDVLGVRYELRHRMGDGTPTNEAGMLPGMNPRSGRQRNG